jgi:hypothetical protein
MNNIMITLLVQVTIPISDPEDDSEVEETIDTVLKKLNQIRIFNASVEDVTLLKGE